jgi:uncharacterized protein
MDIFKRISKIELLLVIASLLIAVALPPLGVLIGFVLVLLYLLVGKNRKENLKSIGFTSPESWTKTILICLFLGIIIELSFQIVLNPIIEKLTNSSIDLTAYDGIRNNFINFLSVLLIGWVAGGFIEEILFRGFLITRISKLFRNINLGNWLAILLTSIIFGFSHLYQGLSGVISTGLISVILGFIFIKYRRILWYSILTHGFINTTALTLMWLDVDTKLGNLLFK